MFVNLTNNLLGYNSMVDITVFFLIVIFLLVLLNSAKIKDYGVTCLKVGLFLTLITTTLKYLFFVTLNKTGGTPYELVSFILYFVYNTLTLCIVCFYIEYLLQVIGKFSKFSITVRHIYTLGFIFSLANSLIRGINQQVIYFDTQYNVWRVITKGITFDTGLYALLVLAVFVLMVKRKHFIKQVYLTLLVTNLMSMLLYGVTSVLLDTSFINVIIMLPYMVLLLMLYTVPFNFITGALNYTNFEQYLLQRQGKKLSYIVIHFTKDMTGVSFNHESGKFLYTFWQEYFLKCFLFELYTNMYVLAIEDTFINEGNIETVIKQELLPFANMLNIDFTIYGASSIDFVENISEFLNLDLYFSHMVKKNSYKVIDSSKIEQAQNINAIVTELHDIAEKRDLNDERILVYCQPVRNIKTNHFDTAEALMRMQLPNIGFVYPDMFIPLAESFNYIHILSLIILNKTCQNIRKLLDLNYIVDRISVNFSVNEFKQDDFCDEVLEIIKRNNIPYEKIAIELTESRNEEDYSVILPKINILKSYGIKFYLDDFGTGYSNFDRILGLNLDVVKFDKSLLDMAETNKNTKFVLTHFSSAFKQLDYKILFEGVETDSQVSLCEASKADYLQGYKYSKPIDIAKLPEFFSKADE
jgi:EAL domain-containing protein (putative c-di-GMP-specific phosphodiesterase class I)